MSGDYFSTPSGPAPESLAPPQFLALEQDVPALEMAPGLHFRPAVGEKLMINLVTFAPHTEAPMHAHEEEQLVYVLTGEVTFTAGDTRHTLRPGDAVIIPPFVPHAAETHEGSCTELDIFAPPRRALLDFMGDRADPDR